MFKYQGNFQVFPGDHIVACSGSEYIVCTGYNPTGTSELWLAFNLEGGLARLSHPSLQARGTRSVNLEAIFDFPNVAKVVRKGQVVKPESPLLDLKVADLKTITLQGQFSGEYYTYEVRFETPRFTGSRLVLVRLENRDVIVLDAGVRTVGDFLRPRALSLVSVEELMK